MCIGWFFTKYGENKLIINEIDDEVRFVLDQHAELDVYSARSLKQLSDTLFWFRANQSLLFLCNAAYLAEKQHIPIL